VLEILSGAGCRIIEETRKGHTIKAARIPPDLVGHSLETAPKSIELYTATGDLKVILGDNTPAFSTGSCGMIYADAGTGDRPSTSSDLGRFIRVADYLEHIDLVSTAMVPNDIDPEIQDAYRLMEVFKNTIKPVVTGIFPQAERNNFGRMKDMLVVIRGSEENLRDKPLAIFDCAPDPLKWSKALSECIIECGKYGIPFEIVSMPQPGLSYPATLYESVVQSVAESFAAVVISQTANQGAPVVWGCSPMTVNFEKGRTDAELASPGAIKQIAAYVSVAKEYGLPTHAYAIADSPLLDTQYGIEKHRVISRAMRAGVDNITGMGMFGEEDVLSCEALVIDNDIIGAELYLEGEIKQKRTDPLEDIAFMADEAVISPETVRYLRGDEFFSPRTTNRDRMTPMMDRAVAAVEEILTKHTPEYLSEEQIRDLESCLA
jgi:trimethylamine--corrinoid protein Co-methyltransferase